MFKYILPFLFVMQKTFGCSVLSFSGGGAYGAFEMGIVSKLFENDHIYDMYTGVSAGSLNAAFMSTINKGDEKNNIDTYKKLWLQFKNSDIYSYELFANGLSIYGTKPLSNTLSKIFDDKKPIRPIMVSATSLTNGTSQIFTNEDINIHGFKDILMSSTAIPIAFPPHQFLNDYFVDGGLTSNIVLDEGISYCLKNYPYNKVIVDVIVSGKKLDRKEIIKLNIFNLLDRLISIIKQQIEYSELLQNITNLRERIIINIYEQKQDSRISMLDFTKTEELWDQGYTMSNVNVRYDILNNNEEFIY